MTNRSCILPNLLLVSALIVGASCQPTNPPTEPPVDATFGADVERIDTAGDIAESVRTRPEVGTGRALTSQDAWSPLGTDADPLAEHRPASVECPDDAYGIERLNRTETLTILTGDCSYFAAGQPIRAAIEKGDLLGARLWHFELTASQGSTAHVALLVDGKIVWEETVEIPADSQLMAPSWRATRSYPAGTPVVLHLHNHGKNTWNFFEFENYD